MKIRKMILIGFVCLTILHTNTFAQEPGLQDRAILEKRLEWFQDQKFGLLIEFGIWAAWGVTESWPLSMDRYQSSKSRINDRPNWKFNFDVYREAYWNLSKVFYPRHFNENQWAEIAKDAGMKYICFYTKHHDGFCMYDTRLTDYKVTNPECPYSDHPNPDITERLSTAFRDRGFGVGMIYSYSDWHSPYYWKPGVPAPDRHMNYDIEKEPERWQKFLDFYMGQIEELMTNYGKIDILWLDGGWDKQHMEVEKMLKMVWSHQPELIVGRGGIPGYGIETPERKIPEKPLGEPWETCESISDFWSFVPYDNYRSTQELIYMLVDIVSKGGNFLLSVPPMPDGRLTPPTVERLKEIGEWLQLNGEAIYGTRVYSMTNFMESVKGDAKVQDYNVNIHYTKKDKYVYAILLDKRQTENDQMGLATSVNVAYKYYPNESSTEENVLEVIHWINLKHATPLPGSEVHLLGVEEPLEWETGPEGTRIYIPYEVIQSPPCKYAYSFRIQVSN
ncbi:alpha-L-fucosidase [Bacteroidota bacterium]